MKLKKLKVAHDKVAVKVLLSLREPITATQAAKLLGCEKHQLWGMLGKLQRMYPRMRLAYVWDEYRRKEPVISFYKNPTRKEIQDLIHHRM